MLSDIQAENTAAIKLIQKIPLSNVKGRIDHLAADLKGKRLFIAALGNNTLEIIDLQTGKQIHTITGLSEPQGIIFIPDSNKLFVSNGGNGRCSVFDANSFNLINDIQFNDDADNMRYDPVTHLIYIGYGSGGIGIIDIVGEKRTGEIMLPAHPEAFELERNGDRIFVNVPIVKQISVIDRKKLIAAANWQLTNANENFTMALDELNQCSFIGCRKPSKLLIFDIRLGKITKELPIDGDADDIFYDTKNKRIYISCGTGFIDVVQQQDASNYNVVEKISTALGARTSLFVPESGLLYLAVPAREAREAEIWIYETK